MKNTNKVFGVIAILAIIGFLMAACEGEDLTSTYEVKEVETAGQLTITGLADYNGLLIRVYTGSSDETDVSICAFQKASNKYTYEGKKLYSVDGESDDYGTITDGKAILKLYLYELMSNGSGIYKSYDGNDKNVNFAVQIGESEIRTTYGEVTVNFTNGVGSGEFVKN